MKDLNKMMPKIPGMRWGVVTNLSPTLANINELNRMLKHDGQWHSVINEERQVHVDGVTVRHRTPESMT